MCAEIAQLQLGDFAFNGSGFDLHTATVVNHAETPVALSEETPLQRKFGMVYDTMYLAVIDLDELVHTLIAFQPGDSEMIAGYEMYGLDATKSVYSG